MSNSKMSKSKRMVKVKLMELIDYAIGGAERGEINLNVMRAFFNSILEKEEIQAEMAFVDPDITKALRESEVKEDIAPISSASTGPPKYRIINPGTPDERKEYLDDREFSLCGRSSDLEFGCVSIGSVFKGTKTMEGNTQVLGDFLEQYNLLRHVNPYEQIHPTILSETWRMLKTVRTVFKNSGDLAEAQITLDQYKDVMSRLREFNDEIRKAVTELTKSAVDETGRPLFSDPFYAMKQALGKVNKVIDRFSDFESELKRINQKVGTGALPSNEFLEKMSSYGNMEALTQNNPITIVPLETRKIQGDPPPTKTFMALCLKLAQMIKYNEEKMRRLKAIEVHMEHLKLKNATKKEAQKLIERMAEVDGIGTAVERLLCRTQKCEDLICSMRQVVNKVYGCITANPNTRYESENIWACLFNQDENSRSGDNAENDLVSDAQMKSFHAQITKIDCEAKIVERNLMSVEAIKVDVKNLFSISNELEENKLDKCVVSTELAKKADRHMVDDKVTRFCFQQTCEGINAVISEILSKILETDKECHKVINFLTSKAHLKADYDTFSNLKEQAEYKLRCLAQRLTNLHNYKKNNSLNNSNTSARRVPTLPAAKHNNKNKSNNKHDDDSALNDNNNNNNINSSNNNNNINSNNNNNSCSSIYGSDSDTSDSFCECRSDFYSDDDDDAERPGLGRFLSQLDKRSRGLVEICQSFKRINDSFRIITQSMYDFDTFKELFEASKASSGQNDKADYNSNNDDDDDDLGSNVSEGIFEGNKMLSTFRGKSDSEFPTFGEASA